MVLAKVWVPPPPGIRLQYVSGSPISDFWVAILISAFKANSNPPPRAGPSMRQKTGQWICLNSLKILLKLVTMFSSSSSVLSNLSLRSAPAQKCPSTLLLKIQALNVGCLLIYWIVVSNYILDRLPGKGVKWKEHSSFWDCQALALPPDHKEWDIWIVWQTERRRSLYFWPNA